MENPTGKQLCEATGISPSYASMILSETKPRTPPRSLAIRIFREIGWRHASIANLTEAQIKVLESVDPWTPPAERTPPAEQAAA